MVVCRSSWFVGSHVPFLTFWLAGQGVWGPHCRSCRGFPQWNTFTAHLLSWGGGITRGLKIRCSSEIPLPHGSPGCSFQWAPKAFKCFQNLLSTRAVLMTWWESAPCWSAVRFKPFKPTGWSVDGSKTNQWYLQVSQGGKAEKESVFTYFTLHASPFPIVHQMGKGSRVRRHADIPLLLQCACCSWGREGRE